ncbi:MAG: hypothetical protein A4E65_03443 [Syntrophorhabdus sp. PtaU1.Bin153]|nr:MAG: hypothetical protein A4E65_03443 [Syntrophorhabdus sp. PtaU1.Bin153]
MINVRHCSVLTSALLLACILAIPGSGIAQDYCDNSNLMSATQQIFYCPLMGKTLPLSAAELGPLPNTKWKVASIVPKPQRAFRSISLSFQVDGNMIETTEEPDGKVVTATQRYRVLGSTMLLSKPGANTNVRFRIDGKTMLVDTGVYSVILERID